MRWLSNLIRWTGRGAAHTEVSLGADDDARDRDEVPHEMDTRDDSSDSWGDDSDSDDGGSDD
jgi:hypothetical protein